MTGDSEKPNLKTDAPQNIYAIYADETQHSAALIR